MAVERHHLFAADRRFLLDAKAGVGRTATSTIKPLAFRLDSR